MSISSSVYRRTRRGKKAARHTISIRHPDGRRTQHAGFTDKAATLQRAAQLVRELERKEVGLHDQFAAARRTELAAHVEAFLTAMAQGTLARRRRGGGADRTYVQRSRARLLLIFRALGASRIEHLVHAEAEAWLAERMRAGWSATTRDHHAALLRQFGSWLVDDQRAAVNPFHRLRPCRNEATRTFLRHALTLAELRALVESAEVRPVQEYRRINPNARSETIERLQADGFGRGTLYLVAAYTGLRRGEITRVQWQDLRLGPDPWIEVRPEIAKNRRRARVELPSWVAAGSARTSPQSRSKGDRAAEACSIGVLGALSGLAGALLLCGGGA